MKRRGKKLRRAVRQAAKEFLSPQAFNSLDDFVQARIKPPVQSLRWSAASSKQAVHILDLDFYRWVESDWREALHREYRLRLTPAPIPLWERAPTDEAISADEVHRVAHRGLSLWQICRVSICKHLGRLVLDEHPPQGLGKDELQIISRYYAWARRCYDELDRRIAELSPDIIAISQGGVYDSRCAVEIARRRGIRVVAVENSFVGDHFFADDLSGFIVNRHRLAVTGSTAREAQPLSPTELARARDFFDNQLGNKSRQHRTSGCPPTLPSGRHPVLFLGQVLTDASVVLDSTVYPDPLDLLHALVRWAQHRGDVQLVIRTHPKEADASVQTRGGRGREVLDGLTRRQIEARRLHELEHVTVVSGRDVDTHQLMRDSRLGITINSQAGLEMRLLGRPVVTCGRCFYAGHGFTRDVQHPEQLVPTVDAALDSALQTADLPPNDAVWRFAHHMFFEALLPKETKTVSPRMARMFGLGVADAR